VRECLFHGLLMRSAGAAPGGTRALAPGMGACAVDLSTPAWV
jgi:hypothetical protein